MKYRPRKIINNDGTDFEGTRKPNRGPVRQSACDLYVEQSEVTPCPAW